ncbi:MULTISPECIES: methyltransferase [Streptomyces]|uniref:Methyltransferase n=1 Tax=Streptomyces glycanivorans TaxID=3033808 RepID=A0ABY9JKK2_9ACTN|nr:MULTISPECIES: methyltransferase [unclassified Streptomyces]WSQ81608.1 methyltransferase [Streptomyces sp. NBC_01213]TXS17777.1 O-methyltransferase [Streptomyces sp. wa22]WLQ68252.1 methyltransferase [Streptomyces sp. Alt3]WSQ88933.1 methyltransferase [Streptomyces sp. NBC_01212]WSR05061.1 methyltransferase [Streptomyces sp. NBC_01208]
MGSSEDFLLPRPAWRGTRELVLHLAAVKWAMGSIRALVQLRIPDRLAEGARTADELAASIDADPSRLYRVLRAAATAGVLREDTSGRFSLAPAADGLRADGADSMRDVFLFTTDPMMWRPYENVQHTVLTGESAFASSFGKPFYEYLRDHPESSDVFDRAMVQNDSPETFELFRDVDFSKYRKIADVGGGRGSFLAEVLRRNPECLGAVCDHPLALSGAGEEFERRGVSDRATAMATDFFEKVPEGFDAYIIKRSLQNWGDEDVRRLLAKVREAMGSDLEARLMIVNHVLAEPGTPDFGKLSDIEMMTVLGGGRERERDEWNRLAAEAGFLSVSEPSAGQMSLLMFRPS